MDGAVAAATFGLPEANGVIIARRRKYHRRLLAHPSFFLIAAIKATNQTTTLALKFRYGRLGLRLMNLIMKLNKKNGVKFGLGARIRVLRGFLPFWSYKANDCAGWNLVQFDYERGALS